MSRTMKDSGIPWIGEIPEGWGKDKIIRVFRTIGSGTTPKSTEESNFGGDINWIQSGDINGGVMSSCKNQVSEETLLNCPALKVYKFPFIIVAMYGASVGNTSISTIDGCVNQACCVLGDSVLNFKYAFSTIKSCKDYWLIKAIGGGQPNISQETIRQTWIPVPPLAEQHLIATFLDKKCSEIDSLIDLQEHMIEELKAYKQSVITEAVTKGIRNEDLGVRNYKDSGIDWIGDVPEEWEVTKFYRVCSVITDFVASGSFESLRINVPYHDYPDYAMLVRTIDLSGKGRVSEKVYISKHSYDFLNNSNLFGGEIILPNIGASVGDVYIVPNLYERMSLAPNSIMFKTKQCDKYWYYYFYSEAGKRAIFNICQSTAQPKFNKTELRDIRVCIPTNKEQQAIADYLDKKCGEIDELITIKQQKIESLKEYKKSVIYEYVTGKKEP